MKEIILKLFKDFPIRLAILLLLLATMSVMPSWFFPLLRIYICAVCFCYGIFNRTGWGFGMYLICFVFFTQHFQAQTWGLIDLEVIVFFLLYLNLYKKPQR